MILLFSGLVLCGAAISTVDAKRQFYEHVLDPPMNKFKALITAESFTKEYQDENVKKQIISHIDSFNGILCYIICGFD